MTAKSARRDSSAGALAAKPAVVASANSRQAITLRLPIRTVNALNVREHWAKRAKRAKMERFLASIAVSRKSRALPPCAVLLTREAPRGMDQGCGLNASLKAIRDGVADALGVNDNDPRVTWAYDQRKSKTYGVVIQIRSVV